MTLKELEKLRWSLPLSFNFDIEPDPREDKYGVYDTGFFEWKSKTNHPKMW